MTTDPVREKLHESKTAVDEIVTLASGVRVRLHPISNVLIQDIVSRIPDPKPPLWHNDDTGKDEENPSHPDYKQAIREHNTKVNAAISSAYIIFGFDLVDGIPEDGAWLQKLKRSEKIGILSLADYDLNDPIDLEYLYKRYVAAPNTPEVQLIASLSQLSGEEIAAQRASFRGDEKRGSN
jgi:hypothetical protein